ncbi:MAG: hypothetical protein H0U59_13130 [Gemmatimonadaceae bacterium]|nr:hypothetical protein [Gemmatimonadaceae bacterium]
MTRKIHVTIAPRYGVFTAGCIERASYTKQDSGPEGTGLGLSPTRVAWRVLGDGPNVACVWRVSCRTPDALLSLSPSPSPSRSRGNPGDVIIGMGRFGDGSVGAMIAWLNADPALGTP